MANPVFQFKLTAFRPNGSGVAGARIRILTPAGVDMTAFLFGPPELITDNYGVWAGREIDHLLPDDLLSAQATVQVIAQYYDTWTTTYPFGFLGIALLTANLTRSAASSNYTVTAPDGAYRSSMTPILTQVETQSNFAWEFIQARVEAPDGTTSAIQTPVDRQTHLATLDIRNRVNLGVRPMLVKEPAVSLPDTEFSSVVTVSYSSITDEGENPLGDEASISVAATLPPNGQTDLSNYVRAQHRDWIVPSLPVIAFRGYYRDVMIWLPVPAAYVLTSTFFDSAGSIVSTTTDNLTDSPYVQRIRINTDPAPTVTRCVLIIKSGATAITQPLTVQYRD